MEKILEDNWKLIIETSINSLKLKIHKNDSYKIYSKIFNYEDLSKLKLFKFTNSNKEIIDIIINIIEENKYKIEENSKNLNLILN